MKGNIMVDCNEIIGDRKNILKWIPISSLKTQLSGDQIVVRVIRSSKERALSKAGIQINRIFNIDIAIFQKINIDIAWAIYCSTIK